MNEWNGNRIISEKILDTWQHWRIEKQWMSKINRENRLKDTQECWKKWSSSLISEEMDNKTTMWGSDAFPEWWQCNSLMLKEGSGVAGGVQMNASTLKNYLTWVQNVIMSTLLLAISCWCVYNNQWYVPNS